MTAETVSIVTPLSTLSESIKVFVHELGHVIDIHFLKQTLLEADPSQEYYGISWVDMTTKKTGASIADFVSGYAMTNKYEDFAETFTYFIFHNNDFALRAKKSQVLASKYKFFKKYVFPDGEFIGTGFETRPIAQYNWDVTKIPIAMNKYLFYIK